MPTSPVRDEYVIADDLTFHYLQWGEQGPPLIFVHGITANAWCFQAFADALSNDFRVFAYDLRGRGDSDKPETGYSIPIHARDLAGIIDALELERPVAVGHSLGAFIALQFAVEYPEKLRKLVLIDAGGRIPWNSVEEQPAWLTASLARLGTPVASFPEYQQRFKMAPFLGPYWNEYVDIYLDHDVYRNSDGSVISKGYPAGIREDQMFYFDPQYQQPEVFWPKVTVPTLLLRAGQGLFTESDQLLLESDARAMQQQIRSCRYVNYPGLNHYTIIFGVSEDPARDIRDFVKEE
jgi:pimeloyl-ACP methyl ester carboxylesterase